MRVARFLGGGVHWAGRSLHITDGGTFAEDSADAVHTTDAALSIVSEADDRDDSFHKASCFDGGYAQR